MGAVYGAFLSMSNGAPESCIVTSFSNSLYPGTPTEIEKRGLLLLCGQRTLSIFTNRYQNQYSGAQQLDAVVNEELGQSR